MRVVSLCILKGTLAGALGAPMGDASRFHANLQHALTSSVASEPPTPALWAALGAEAWWQGVWAAVARGVSYVFLQPVGGTPAPASGPSLDLLRSDSASTAASATDSTGSGSKSSRKRELRRELERQSKREAEAAAVGPEVPAAVGMPRSRTNGSAARASGPATVASGAAAGAGGSNTVTQAPAIATAAAARQHATADTSATKREAPPQAANVAREAVRRGMPAPPPSRQELALWAALRDAAPVFATGPVAAAAAGLARSWEEDEARTAVIVTAAESVAAQLAVWPRQPAEASALELFGIVPRASGDASGLPAWALLLLCALVRDAIAPFAPLAPDARRSWSSKEEFEQALRVGQNYLKSAPVVLQAERFRRRAGPAERLAAELLALYGLRPAPRVPAAEEPTSFGFGPSTLHALALAAVQDALAQRGGPQVVAAAAVAAGGALDPMQQLLGLTTLRALLDGASAPSQQGGMKPLAVIASGASGGLQQVFALLSATELLEALARGLCKAALRASDAVLKHGPSAGAQLIAEQLGLSAREVLAAPEPQTTAASSTLGPPNGPVRVACAAWLRRLQEILPRASPAAGAPQPSTQPSRVPQPIASSVGPGPAAAGAASAPVRLTRGSAEPGRSGSVLLVPLSQGRQGAGGPQAAASDRTGHPPGTDHGHGLMSARLTPAAVAEVHQRAGSGAAAVLANGVGRERAGSVDGSVVSASGSQDGRPQAAAEANGITAGGSVGLHAAANGPTAAPCWLPPPTARDKALWAALRDAMPEFGTGPIAEAAAGKGGGHAEQEARAAALYVAAEALAIQLEALPRRPAEASGLELFGTAPRASGDGSGLPALALLMLCALMSDALGPYRALAPGAQELWTDPGALAEGVRANEVAAKAAPALQAERFRRRAGPAERLAAALHALYGLPPLPLSTPGPGFCLGPATLHALALAAVQDAVSQSQGPEALASAAASAPPGVLSKLLGLPALRTLLERASAPSTAGSGLDALAYLAAARPGGMSWVPALSAAEVLTALARGLLGAVEWAAATATPDEGASSTDDAFVAQYAEMFAQGLAGQADTVRSAPPPAASPSSRRVPSALREPESQERKACAGLLLRLPELAGVDQRILKALARAVPEVRAATHAPRAGGGGGGGGGGGTGRSAGDGAGGSDGPVLLQEYWPTLGAEGGPPRHGRGGPAKPARH
ncbi:hypothetical protein HYH03_013473 [Edaphochlamys debaryana]|uniref:Uncharacterized protein n=1 Tax=Edaphochlamys debaryana TaxID=47281 RepID=A0A835XPX4_9CHLO|nr:hypothetical protein HYH03_013473 [Edaphochlamys debaryana]|eukprot:KAG2487891.1 hypothetical protein HYH03_013473 [Edaphochlamys debaryana]